jgi:hypothetical protein
VRAGAGNVVFRWEEAVAMVPSRMLEGATPLDYGKPENIIPKSHVFSRVFGCTIIAKGLF